MAKIIKKSPSYLSPKKLLTKKEYRQYQEQQQEPRRAELKEKLKQGARNLKIFQAQRRYATSKTGRFGSFLTKGIKRVQQPRGFTRALYQRNIPITSQNVQQEYPTMPSRVLRGSSSGRVGRPKGTYDRRYASVGGVYGYRKLLAAQLRERRLQLQRQATISPQQQMVINQYQAQQAYNQQNVEGKIIPDTAGNVSTRGIMDEINQACNIFP